MMEFVKLLCCTKHFAGNPTEFHELKSRWQEKHLGQLLRTFLVDRRQRRCIILNFKLDFSSFSIRVSYRAEMAKKNLIQKYIEDAGVSWKMSLYFALSTLWRTLIQNVTVSFRKSKIQSCSGSKITLITFVKDISKHPETLVFAHGFKITPLSTLSKLGKHHQNVNFTHLC